MTVSVRRATVDEADALSDIIFRSKQANGYDDTFMDLCRDVLKMTPARIEGSVVLVAVDERNQPLGCASLDNAKEEDGGDIHLFFIDPNHHRKGVGRELFNALMAEAKSASYAALYLDADPEAVAFYQAMGFSIIGDSPSDAIPGRTLPRMWRLV